MWFFVTLLPVCQIFPHHELMAEHYLYLPLVGYILVVSALWQHLLQKRKAAALAGLCILVLLFSGRTVWRNRDWKDPMTLWASVVNTAPQCARAHDNLGTEYLKLKDYTAALVHYQEAVRLRPEHAIFHNNLGRAYGVLDDMQNAQKSLETAVALNPALAEAYNNLGIVYYQKKDFKKAAELFWKSGALKPAHMASYNYAKSVLQLGSADEAIRAFQQALQYKPDYAEAYQELAIVYWGKGERTKSQEYLQKALAVAADPGVRQRIEKALDYVKNNDK
jgi:tetratricopeptide (TPR) repeat protein